MKKELKERWIAALRSGDYSQSIGCLQDHNGWCCLGVLTELYLKENENKDVQVGLEDPMFGTLPNEVMDWAGMATNGGFLIYNNEPTDLTSLNDCAVSKRGFKRIADIIEKNWEQL